MTRTSALPELSSYMCRIVSRDAWKKILILCSDLEMI
uniref:Uncharacterized protein n=1 Tax=Arundo donax TaxID=35708 RepID=A0A0A9CQU0_ARUDO